MERNMGCDKRNQRNPKSRNENRDALEIDIQRAFFDWVEFKRLNDERFRLVFPTLNNALPATPMMGKLRKLGMTAGVPDVIGLIPAGLYHGFIIEFKRRNGKVSQGQMDFLKLATKQRYFCGIAYSHTAAIKAVNEYLKKDISYYTKNRT